MSVQLPTRGGTDLSAAQIGTSNSISFSNVNKGAVGGKRPTVVFNNESGCGLSIRMRGSNREMTLPAGAWTDPIPVENTDSAIEWYVDYVLPNQPVATLYVTYYYPWEIPLKINALGNSPIGISGNVQTSNVQSLANDGKAPATSIIESTPSDQVTSSFALDNDGSGFWQVLSANVLRKIINVVRGNSGATKAVVDIGDTTDLSITTYHGIFDAAVAFPGAQVTGTVPTASNSNSLGNNLSALNAGATPTNKPTLKTNQTAGSTYDFYVRVWDGTTAHDALLVDHTGLRYTDAAGIQAGAIPAGVTIPGSQVSSAVANATVAAQISPTSTTAVGDCWGFPIDTRSGQACRWGSQFAGTGAGTYTHGFGNLVNNTGASGIVPNSVLIITTQANSTQTMGVDTITATQVHCNMPNAWPFNGFAQRM